MLQTWIFLLKKLASINQSKIIWWDSIFEVGPNIHNSEIFLSSFSFSSSFIEMGGRIYLYANALSFWTIPRNVARWHSFYIIYIYIPTTKQRSGVTLTLCFYINRVIIRDFILWFLGGFVGVEGFNLTFSSIYFSFRVHEIYQNNWRSPQLYFRPH